jgi:hypothetical protein
MFDELTKYKTQNHFFYKATDILKEVCNAPNDKGGVYLIYALAKGKVELIYVGRSGKRAKDGKITIRKAGLGGIKDRLINGHQFGKVPRHKSWANQMSIEKIDALDIYWYITHDLKNNDCPREVENTLLDKHLKIFGRLPKWNNET